MFLRGFTMAEIEEEQHQDFIWTWKSNGRGNKVSVWLPYFSEVSKRQRYQAFSRHHYSDLFAE